MIIQITKFSLKTFLSPKYRITIIYKYLPQLSFKSISLVPIIKLDFLINNRYRYICDSFVIKFKNIVVFFFIIEKKSDVYLRF